LFRQGNPTTQHGAIETELQADCYAGVWAYSVNRSGVFSPGEINQALSAAAAVGDDNIQEKTEGRVNPEIWTHGSSEQRTSSFNKGFETGQPGVCVDLNK
jgi:predicted metalloprotease